MCRARLVFRHKELGSTLCPVWSDLNARQAALQQFCLKPLAIDKHLCPHATVAVLLWWRRAQPNGSSDDGLDCRTRPIGEEMGRTINRPIWKPDSLQVQDTMIDKNDPAVALYSRNTRRGWLECSSTIRQRRGGNRERERHRDHKRKPRVSHGF